MLQKGFFFYMLVEYISVANCMFYLKYAKLRILAPVSSVCCIVYSVKDKQNGVSFPFLFAQCKKKMIQVNQVWV